MDYLTTHTNLSPIWCGFTPAFVNYKKGCTRLAVASDKVTSCLPMVGGSFRVLRLLPPLKVVRALNSRPMSPEYVLVRNDMEVNELEIHHYT